VIAAVVALAAAVASPGSVSAQEEPVVSIDGTICYEKYKESQFVPVRLSDKSEKDVVVVLHTENGTAKSPEDYRGFDGLQVVIPAGQQLVLVPLVIVDDQQKERDEYFVVVIDAAYGAVVGNDKARVIIKDGVPPPK
jgi:Calx-beta domain